MSYPAVQIHTTPDAYIPARLVPHIIRKSLAYIPSVAAVYSLAPPGICAAVGAVALGVLAGHLLFSEASETIQGLRILTVTTIGTLYGTAKGIAAGGLLGGIGGGLIGGAVSFVASSLFCTNIDLET